MTTTATIFANTLMNANNCFRGGKQLASLLAILIHCSFIHSTFIIVVADDKGSRGLLLSNG